MRRFVEEADRGQQTLLPECLDDFIDESNLVHVIDVFVDALGLAEMGFEGAEPTATGRPSYHPSVLLKLYGYLNRAQPAAGTRGRAQCRGDVAAGSARSRSQDDCGLPQGQRPGAAQGMRPRFVELCRDGPAGDSERRHRWQQVQGREQPGQELYVREGGAAACSVGGERRALSEPT